MSVKPKFYVDPEAVMVRNGPPPKVWLRPSARSENWAFHDILRKLEPGQWLLVPGTEGDCTNPASARKCVSVMNGLKRWMQCQQLVGHYEMGRCEDGSGVMVLRLPPDQTPEQLAERSRPSERVRLALGVPETTPPKVRPTRATPLKAVAS